jgi:hypothetical protein
MQLFNASSLFTEENIKEVLTIVGDPQKLKARSVEVKEMLLNAYKFTAYNTPEDFAKQSYIIATNHLTDSDAPLILSYHSRLTHKTAADYPGIFTFAKENCFNGVSIPKELAPILEFERIFPVDRNSFSGSVVAMKAARAWFKNNSPAIDVPNTSDNPQAKHFLIFAQGTIYDINKDNYEDIEPGAFWLASLLGIPVLPAFIEQLVEGQENHMVFAKPIIVPEKTRKFEEFQKQWLHSVIDAQNQLKTLTGKPAREVRLDASHQVRKKF